MGDFLLNLKIKVMFKIGQKVVFVDNDFYKKNPIFNFPQNNTIVTVFSYGSNCRCGCNLPTYVIEEYRYNQHGIEQEFSSDILRPLDESFAEGILENILTKIKEKELETV